VDLLLMKGSPGRSSHADEQSLARAAGLRT